MNEITKDENQRPKTQNHLFWLLLVFSAVFVYLFALGGFPLVGPDEPRYAEVAREMFERGDWLTPTLGGATWFEKPVLLYALQIFFYKLFGVSEFAARLGSALFGLGTVLCLWILGKWSVVGDQWSVENFTAEAQRRGEDEITETENQKPETDFANWLAVIAASSVGLLVFSRGASFDIILTFPLTACLVGFFIFDRSEQKSGFVRYLSLSAFYFFIGVALLAKGLVGIVFPMAIVGLYHILSRKIPGKIFLLSLFWGTILSLLVASVWYLPMYLTHGWTFVDEFFIQHHFQRFASDKYQHRQPFWFFWLVLPLMTLPWLPFFLASIWSIVKGIFYHRDTETQSEAKINANRRFSVFSSQFSVLSSPLLLFALSWLLVPLVFFSFSGSKLPGYILPALPAALVLTAEFVFRFVQQSRRRRIVVQSAALVTFVVVALLLQFVVPRFAENDSVRDLIRQADAKGFERDRITNLFKASHNAEFYAAGRLVRETGGKLKIYDDFLILVEDLRRENRRQILVLVPSGSTNHITDSALVESEILADNGNTALVLVLPK
jgi:4-amino-4-deoxy-L-arabinose transferase-like glycosyltransferase